MVSRCIPQVWKKAMGTQFGKKVRMVLTHAGVTVPFKGVKVGPSSNRNLPKVGQLLDFGRFCIRIRQLPAARDLVVCG